ncbi:MAG: zinc-ribbon domain-containing protein [Pseudomonadota bacterium]|nr:zinc-ribbon domain-containing protein [Pseudomonadota bacterium]
MIVTCESCKSRYKLDDAKITGRGAKITCPKCTNVFVVYAQPDPASADEASAPVSRASGAPSPGGPPPWEPKKSGGLADVVKSSDRSIVPGTPGSPGRVVAGTATPTPSAAPRSAPSPAGAPSPGLATRPPTRPVTAPTAWDDEPTRVGGSLPTPEEMLAELARHEAANASASPGPGATAADAGGKDPAAMAARAAALDFRKVGVTTWKVKVKIGLIYDFSDIKTLRKYIQDGRVTSADVVSWDGKVWRAIGDIPDLDAFFVEAWDILAARKSESPTLNPTAPIGPSAGVETPRVEEAAAPTPPPRNGGEPDRFVDPFADLKKKKERERADQRRTGPVVTPATTKKADTPAPSRLPLILAVLLLLILVAGGTAWWMDQAAVASPPGTAGKPVPAAKTPDQIRDEINKKLEATLEGNPAPDEIVAPDELGLPPPDERRPVLPAASGRPQSGVPEGAVPIKSTRGASPTASNLNQADQTAADHEAVGDDAASGGDWATASQAYKKAVALDARNARLAGKLGRALYEGQDYSNAQPALDRAAKGGTKEAYKYLGHIARLQGDTALANSQYQQYLKGSPRDAAEIEQIIAQMSGG